MGVKRVFAALIAAALLFSGSVAEGKWSVAPPQGAAEAAFDGAYYTAKGRLTAERMTAPHVSFQPSPLQYEYEFELSVRETAEGAEAELVLDQLRTFAGKEPALANRVEASLSISAGGANGLVKYTELDNLGNAEREERYSAALDGDGNLTVRDESTGEVIFDSGILEVFGTSVAGVRLAEWGAAIPELEESAETAFGPLLNKLDGFLFGFSDSAVLRMRELALPVAQFFSDPRVDRALATLGMPGLPIPRMSLLELLAAANGVFELRRLDDGNVSILFCSEGSPETSAFKVEVILRRSSLDFKVLRNNYGEGYETIGGGELDLSDGLHFAVEDYQGTFLYLDASIGEMSPRRQVLDGRAAFKLSFYDDPELMLLHLENAIDDEAGTARTDATLRQVEAGSTTTIALEVDHTFKE